jgi:hypothetical protein
MMARVVRKTRNPVERLQDLVSQLGNVTESILEEAEKPDFAGSIALLKTKMQDAAAKKVILCKDAKEVSRHLQMYPGISRQVLASLRMKIAEYKSLGVLEKYKTEAIPRRG